MKTLPPPRRSLEKVAEKHETQKIGAVSVKIGEGNAARVTPDHFSNLSDITTIDTAIKRE
jgi:hypothetical protein